ncbi:phage antirepressor KilAC domain-containing protein [Caloramator sp. CAR-1]|uniref:phage antirepressor KilAC domain-containing protein n=1 Tax=Caloramator sp. CAR-1 TaxID=3062777 RepID=UPI0026E3E4DD|nr:phage antirepressor KilAC domain-containing protein [Caloramator sp. CAR-1]MDO6353555.1 phage antirepressor KilAC domain-containing protein [Caloramator sp. CAR-1]
MNELQVFKNDLFEIAVKLENGEILFDAEKVAKCLGITQKKNGIEYVRWERVNEYLKVSPQVGKGSFIPEPAVYKLAFKANNEVAEKFQDWLAIEVIPTIRKHGAYLTPQKIEEVLLNPDTIIQLATQLKEERAKRIEAEQKIQILQPKAEFFDAVAGSKDAIDMNRAAKLIYEETKLGRNKLFKFLREKGILMKDNIPYQEYIDKGYFRTIEQKYNKPDGTTCIYIKTLVYQKGLDFIRRLLKNDGLIKAS